MKLGYYYSFMVLLPLILGAASEGRAASLVSPSLVVWPSVDERSLKEHDSHTLERLKKTLSTDSSYKVRLRAVTLLGELIHPDAVKALSEVVRSDSHSAVRAAALTTLGRMKSVLVIPPILESAAIDADEFVRKQARRVLYKLDRSTVFPFVVAISDSEELKVRKEALLYLGAQWSPKADGVLIRAFGDFPEMFRVARQILRGFSQARQLAVLSKATEHSAAAVQVGAVELLAGMVLPGAPELILRVYQRGLKDDSVREVVQRALRAKRSQLPVGEFVNRADSLDENVETRAGALILLGTIGGAQAEAALLRALRADSLLLQGTAAIALGKTGNPVHLGVLEAMLSEPSNRRIQVHLKTAIRQLSLSSVLHGNGAISKQVSAAQLR